MSTTKTTLTNRCNLPEPLVRAVQWSDYDHTGFDYSVSTLLRPARMVALEQIHRDEITEDASDRLWLLLGSAGHQVLERAASDTYVVDGKYQTFSKGIVEERAIVEVEVDGKLFKVGGKLDYGTTDTTLYDYKFCTVYTKEPREDWIAQLNIYAWLARRYGVDFEKLQIVAIFRDWSKPKASREPDYPQAQVKVFDLPLWRDDTTEQFIIDRIRAHESAKVTLPECSAEEMWEKPAVWAVKKPGAKRAKALCFSQYEAATLADASAMIVEHRPAERPRCESYCLLGGDSGLCEQWVKFKQAHP